MSGVAQQFKGYCMKCKDKRDMKNVEKVLMGKTKNRHAVKGSCAQCSCGMFKILSKDEIANFDKAPTAIKL